MRVIMHYIKSIIVINFIVLKINIHNIKNNVNITFSNIKIIKELVS